MANLFYADMHCDTITSCLNRGQELSSFSGHINTVKLHSAGCAAQCFAIFTDGENAEKDFFSALAFYRRSLKSNTEILHPALASSDLETARRQNKTASVLTVENLAFLGGDVTKIPSLRRAGVRMASLVWNHPNQFAYPNLIWNGGAPQFGRREKRGLTRSGKEAVAALADSKIVIDVSHLSDGGVEDILSMVKTPVVASHSNCAAVKNVSRNLTDGQIKKIADHGGVVGVNFCADFVGDDLLPCLLAHIKRIISVGGEDAAAIGSDFDGIPTPRGMESCEKIPFLFDYLTRGGVSRRAAEKFAYGNFARVFREVVG